MVPEYNANMSSPYHLTARNRCFRKLNLDFLESAQGKRQAGGIEHTILLFRCFSATRTLRCNTTNSEAGNVDRCCNRQISICTSYGKPDDSQTAFHQYSVLGMAGSSWWDSWFTHRDALQYVLSFTTLPGHHAARVRRSSVATLVAQSLADNIEWLLNFHDKCGNVSILSILKYYCSI